MRTPLSEEAQQRLLELAGNCVPVEEIAAFLKWKFKVDITAEVLKRDYADAMRAGRALEIEKVSKQMKATAIEGSPGAQKAWMDQMRESDRAVKGPGGKSKGGGRIKLIRLVVEDVEYQKQRRAYFGRRANKARAAKEDKQSKAQSSEGQEPETPDPEWEDWEGVDWCSEEDGADCEDESGGPDDTDS